MKLLLPLMLAVGLTTVQAGNLQGNEESCQHFSRFIYETAELRNQNIDEAAFRAWFDPLMKQHAGNPETYIERPEDIAFVEKWVSGVWELDQTPDQLQALVYAKCMVKRT